MPHKVAMLSFLFLLAFAQGSLAISDRKTKNHCEMKAHNNLDGVFTIRSLSKVLAINKTYYSPIETPKDCMLYLGYTKIIQIVDKNKVLVSPTNEFGEVVPDSGMALIYTKSHYKRTGNHLDPKSSVLFLKITTYENFLGEERSIETFQEM